MKLVQTRKCDGQCCIDQPQFPVNGRCRYLTSENLCELHMDITKCPGEDVDHFLKICKRYPQFTRPGRGLLNCCWKWVDGD